MLRKKTKTKKTRRFRKPGRDLRMDNSYMAWVGDIKVSVVHEMNTRHLKVSDLAEMSGKCPETIRRFLSESPDWKRRTMAPRGDTLFALTSALGIPFGVASDYLGAIRGVGNKRKSKGGR